MQTPIHDLPATLTDLAALDQPLGPLDGRYRATVAPLTNYLSEAALNRGRIHVEVEWAIYLLGSGVFESTPALTPQQCAYLRRLVPEFGSATISALAQIEAQTRHDVKAVEYLIKNHIDAGGAVFDASTRARLHEIVHIFCTSEDINNLAYALTIKAAMERVWLPAARALTAQIEELARTHARVPMLARTHGQPATPVTLGKELAVFGHRLNRQLRALETCEYLGKLNGATGTWAAHRVALPGADWPRLAAAFVTSLGLDYNPLTTQIESHDWQAELFSRVAHFNRIVHNFATDVWTYIGAGYFVQNLAAQGSTGSSTMPHKVNPIRFENAEANMEISSALLDSLAATLVTSRLQRDLTDSTTQRNIGTALGHSLLAIDNVRRGLAGLDVDAQAMARDLDNNWEVLGEAVQQTMRVAAISGREGLENPYERLKELTRGRKVSGPQMREFIAGLGLDEAMTARLQELTPASYIGYAPELGAGEI